MMPEKDYVGCQAIWVVDEFHSLTLFVLGVGVRDKEPSDGDVLRFQSLAFCLTQLPDNEFSSSQYTS